MPFLFCDFSEYEEKLQALSGVCDELERVSSDKNTLEKELSNLEGKYKVMETLCDSQETELQTLKVKSDARIAANTSYIGRVTST